MASVPALAPGLSRDNSESQSDDDSDDNDIDFDGLDLFGLSKSSSDGDNESRNNNPTKQKSSNSITIEDLNSNKPAMTLKQRRRSRGAALTINILATVCHDTPVRKHWKLALLKACKQEDPWEDFHIENLETEIAIRHRYNALKKKWSQDEVQVKMQSEPFNRGAMRQCFRLKKLSNFAHQEDWTRASCYVAKKYMENVDRPVYFDDVRLQMDAKLWGEEYNRHKPPKKVDIFQMYILQFKNREGSPLYHLEHYIEGDYVKYNSNSGFVEETSRLTPQAFSHFTFERSGHRMIVVDIQGVGDLYTDPQIHTADGEEYGDGNLGTKGMSLFFHSHVCNEICERLGLSHFDLSDSEKQLIKKYIALLKSSTTHLRGEEELCVSASPREQVDLTEFLRQRTISSSSSHSDSQGPCFDLTDEEPMSPINEERMRYYSTSPDDSETPTSSESDTLSKEQERQIFSNTVHRLARPSSVAFELNMRNQNLLNIKMGDSILGQIHHELSKYHEVGRFITNTGHNPLSIINAEDIDWESALFHEEIAAQLGVMEAILTLAKLYLNMQHDVLVNCTVQLSDDNMDRGIDYMVQAARAGDRTAMLYMAKAYQSGNGLGTGRTRCYGDAIYWYDKSLDMEDHDEGGHYDSTSEDPTYKIVANKAEMYLSGGYGLDTDPQKAGDLYAEAAEEAMNAMKGKLSNKYYCLSEEAHGMLEE